MRIHFFPGPELEAKLIAEAANKGVNLSILVVDALNKYYGLVGPNTKTEAQLETDVLNEIAEYIANLANANIGEFDINAASTTYSQIDMTYAGKPKVVKARIGKKFNQEVGQPGRFANVEQVFLPNGNPKRTVGNRAALYRIKSSRID